MLSRSFSILIASWLPFLPLMLPMGPFHTANAIVSGIVATLLSLAAFVDNRARIGTAIVGAWVALSPFIFSATLIEKVVTVSWGVAVFVHLIGPFADPVQVSVTRPLTTRTPPLEEERTYARAA